MYRAFFGLRERPFDLTANPRFLYLSKGHREALSLLHYGIAGDKGITLLLGEAGTGKTTILRAACQQQAEPAVHAMHLADPVISRQELHEFIAYELQLPPSATASKVAFLRGLHHALHERRATGRHTALVVDEGQTIPDDLFEEIRMLANLESSAGKLLSVVLTAQPELAHRLNEPVLRPFKQRIALRTSLPAFTLQETAGYVATRIRIAGGSAAELFSSAAIEGIHRASRGIARTISVICDNALIATFALRQPMVTEALVREVCADLDLEMGPVVPEGHPLASRMALPLEAPPAVSAEDTVPVQLLGSPVNAAPPLAVSIVPTSGPVDTSTETVAQGRGRLFAVPK